MLEVFYWTLGFYYLLCCALCAVMTLVSHRQNAYPHLTKRDYAIIGTALIIFSPLTLAVVVYQILRDLNE